MSYLGLDVPMGVDTGHTQPTAVDEYRQDIMPARQAVLPRERPRTVAPRRPLGADSLSESDLRVNQLQRLKGDSQPKPTYHGVVILRDQ